MKLSLYLPLFLHRSLSNSLSASLIAAHLLLSFSSLCLWCLLFLIFLVLIFASTENRWFFVPDEKTGETHSSFFYWLDAKIRQTKCREWISARIKEKKGELWWQIWVLPVSFWSCHGYPWGIGHHIKVWNIHYMGQKYVDNFLLTDLAILAALLLIDA